MTDMKLNDMFAFLEKDYDKPVERDMPLQNDRLDSRLFNQTMETIEKELNALYEKTRVLDDAITYMESFLAEKIDLARARIAEKLNRIEAARDKLKSWGAVVKSVPFGSLKETLKDRDGESLLPAEIDSGRIVPGFSDLKTIRPKSISKTASDYELESNLDYLLDGKAYRAQYFLEKPKKDGVWEKITVLFDEPEEISYIRIHPVNAKVLAIEIINENGMAEEVAINKNECHIDRKAKGAIFTILAKEYKSV